MPFVREQGRSHQALRLQRSDQPHASLQSDVSCGTFVLPNITIELTAECVAIFVSPIGKMIDETLNLISRSVAQRLHAAKIGGVRLDEVGIELMLADDLAETISDGAATTTTVRLGSQPLGLWRNDGRFGERTDFFNRADANSVRLPQSTIDGARFGNAH